jgi:tetratricopeptide (TPR) repeat protein
MNAARGRDGCGIVPPSVSRSLPQLAGRAERVGYFELHDARKLLTTNPMALDSDSSASPAPPSPRGRWLVIAIAIGLVVVPWLWSAIPAEIARWYSAAAAEAAELENDVERALQHMDRAIRWNPREANLYAYRANLKLKQKDLDGAVVDADRAVNLSGNASLYPLTERVLVDQRRGDHARALRDADRIVQLAEEGAGPQVLPIGQAFQVDYAAALNLRAYARALAQQDIDQGLRDINQAFQRAGTEEIAEYLDTRGYLLYLAGKHEAADKDMQRAVELAEKSIAEFAAVVEGREVQGTDRDARMLRRRKRQLDETLAVLLHHRGLVHEALQRTEQAAADFERARQLGYSPQDGVW